MTYLEKPTFSVSSDWRPPKLSELPSWEGVKRLALDTETCDPEIGKPPKESRGIGVRFDGFIAGISFAIENGPSYYLPIAHKANEDNLDRERVLEYLKDQAKVFTGTMVGMNLPYDLDYLAEAGVVFRRAAWFRDVSIAACLICELDRGYSLDAILLRNGLPPKAETDLERAAAAWCLDPKADLWRLPARHVGKYAIGDVELPLRLLRRQEREIEEQELEQIWDLESQVLPVTVKIRRRGVRIDLKRLEQVEHWALSQEVNFLDMVKHLTGVEITPEHILKKDLTVAALATVGIQLPLTPTGQPKTTAKVLEGIDHDVGRWIVRAKKFHKMRCDFAGSIKRHMVNGRIHATFRQMKGGVDGKTEEEKGAAYGRFSGTDPNLMQQYSKEKEPEISAMWRNIYLPEEGAKWTACDYSAQEPRMTVHFASVAKCKGADEMVAKYCENPRLDLHQATAGLCREAFECLDMKWNDDPKKNEMRKASKVILLGLCYGMGGAKLCRDLGLPTSLWTPPDSEKAVPVAGDEGRALLNQFHSMVPFVKDLSEMCQNRGQGVGFIRTLLGRKCRFPINEFESYGEHVVYDDKETYKALNRLIQGSSADQGKQALVDADAAGFFVQVPIHDELDASVADRAEAERLGDVMVHAVELRVPTVVDVELGPSWGEAK